MHNVGYNPGCSNVRMDFFAYTALNIWNGLPESVTPSVSIVYLLLNGMLWILAHFKMYLTT